MTPTCSCQCGCQFSARNGLCHRCREGRHVKETQACECPDCVCRDANRLTRVAYPVIGTLMVCLPCTNGQHNLLRLRPSVVPDTQPPSGPIPSSLQVTVP